MKNKFISDKQDTKLPTPQKATTCIHNKENHDSNQSPNKKKICCEECLLEKWRHNQTKRALNRAIGLAHRLMQECRRLEGRVAELESAKRDE